MLIITKLSIFFLLIFIKNRETILMNRNLLVAGILGFIASAVIAELYALYSPSDVLTSTITVLVEFIIYNYK